MKSNYAKGGNDELLEKLIIKQHRVLTFLWESTREEDVDTEDIEDIEEEINDKSEFDIRRKEREEELEGEEIEKEL